MRAIIFDNDGVIVDTEPLHFEARRVVLLELGIELSKSVYIQKGISRDHREFLSAVCPPDKLRSDQYDYFFHRKIQVEYRRLRDEKLDLVPGFTTIFKRLSLCRKFFLGVASTQPREMVETGLMVVLPSTNGCFGAIVSGEDVKKNKPAPDVYLEAARRLKIHPLHCIAVEDSVSGVMSAKAAGMVCIARKSEWANPADLLSAGADHLAESDYSDLSIPMLQKLVPN